MYGSGYLSTGVGLQLGPVWNPPHGGKGKSH